MLWLLRARFEFTAERKHQLILGPYAASLGMEKLTSDGEGRIGFVHMIEVIGQFVFCLKPDRRRLPICPGASPNFQDRLGHPITKSSDCSLNLAPYTNFSHEKFGLQNAIALTLQNLVRTNALIEPLYDLLDDLR